MLTTDGQLHVTDRSRWPLSIVGDQASSASSATATPATLTDAVSVTPQAIQGIPQVHEKTQVSTKSFPVYIFYEWCGAR